MAGTPPNAVLLSHAHPDHTGFITAIASSVSVYATIDASKVMKVGSIYARGVSIPAGLFKAVPVPRSWREAARPFTVGDLFAFIDEIKSDKNTSGPYHVSRISWSGYSVQNVMGPYCGG